ncbi:hypothetical protein RCO48_11085 [Peribacillus frigoritolerans]|nr:hypothetical protein [Peribacillus frigoritolerans]
MIGEDVRDSCGKKRVQGRPAGESRGGPRTARGKRVPYVPINGQIVQAIKKCRQTRFSSSLSTFQKQPFFQGLPFYMLIIFKLL